MQANWGGRKLSVTDSAPGGPPFIGMRVLSCTDDDDQNVLTTSGPAAKSTVSTVTNTTSSPVRITKSSPGTPSTSRKKQLGLVIRKWPIESSPLAKQQHSIPNTVMLADVTCDEPCEHNSMAITVDPDLAFPFPNATFNGHGVSFPRGQNTLGDGYLGERETIVHPMLQLPLSTSIPDVCRSDMDRLKRLQRFTTQQARSVEELTKRHRKVLFNETSIDLVNEYSDMMCFTHVNSSKSSKKVFFCDIL
ncbi:unnamed protein product [Echinostoma caproni]|uniref:CDK5 and ABL1 enzyme substrate 1 n=1 Tax=Echinostoma caproni TaxID=27848 RepID=A0A183AG26_9TREM|nr:unnamed protein product [Echinostoma caproni]